MAKELFKAVLKNIAWWVVHMGAVFATIGLLWLAYYLNGEG